MKAQLTEEEKNATLDAIDRFKASDPGLQKTYAVEFVIANFNGPDLISIESFLIQNEVSFDELKRVDSDIFVIIKMKLDSKRVIDIESYLTYFANENDLKYEGWGAFE